MQLEIMVAAPHGATAAEIGYACGFAGQAHFTREFSVSTGLAPVAWRRQFGCRAPA